MWSLNKEFTMRHGRFLRTTALVSLALGWGFSGWGQAVAADVPQSRDPVLEIVEDEDNIIEVEGAIEVQNDWTFDSDDPTAEINDLFATIEVGIDFRPVEWLFFHTDIVTEAVLDPGPGEDRVFEDHGTYLETLYGGVQIYNAQIFGGKINPSFGTAWDTAPGIYGADFAEDYELTERIGFGVAVELGGPDTGVFVVTSNAFFTDTTALSQSAFTNRGRTRLADGGPSNTESLESFSITVDASDIPALPGFTAHGGFRHQAAGVGDFGDENGGVFGITQAFDIDDESAFEVVAEIAYFDQFGAGANDNLYAIIGGAYTTGPWNAAIAYTLREISDGPVGTNFTDHLVQVSAGRELFHEITLDLGYKFAREGGVDSHTFGVLLAREFGFAVPRSRPVYEQANAVFKP